MVYVLGINLGTNGKWMLLGVFDSEEAAVAACNNENQFVGPVELNKRLLDDIDEGWPGLYFPMLEAITQ